jgi:hypothetical protein
MAWLSPRLRQLVKMTYFQRQTNRRKGRPTFLLCQKVGGPLPRSTVSSIWGKARLRDRCDAVIAHEYHEGQGVSHSEAERRAADTELRITDGARRILRAMAERER